ncbi:hypothetical protein C6H68_21820 [Photorhabdus luminescens]|nr:hypothetical protein C6H68_21820 [Photorhabdus luminescens]
MIFITIYVKKTRTSNHIELKIKSNVIILYDDYFELLNVMEIQIEGMWQSYLRGYVFNYVA